MIILLDEIGELASCDMETIGIVLKFLVERVQIPTLQVIIV